MLPDLSTKRNNPRCRENGFVPLYKSRQLDTEIKVCICSRPNSMFPLVSVNRMVCLTFMVKGRQFTESKQKRRNKTERLLKQISCFINYSRYFACRTPQGVCVLPHKTTSHDVIIYVYPDTCNFKEVVGGIQINHQIYLQCFKNDLLICNLV